MAEHTLAPGQKLRLLNSRVRKPARVFVIRYQTDINNLTQRDVESLPLNGIGLVEMTFG